MTHGLGDLQNFRGPVPAAPHELDGAAGRGRGRASGPEAVGLRHGVCGPVASGGAAEFAGGGFLGFRSLGFLSCSTEKNSWKEPRGGSPKIPGMQKASGCHGKLQGYCFRV